MTIATRTIPARQTTRVGDGSKIDDCIELSVDALRLREWRQRLMNCMDCGHDPVVSEQFWISRLFDDRALNALAHVSKVCGVAVYQVRGGMDSALKSWMAFLKQEGDDTRYELAEAWTYLCERLETAIDVVALTESGLKPWEYRR